MNINKLATNAINKIKATWGLPKSGFIAGGSIANLIWEEVSGNKAVVNDIDVFIFSGFLEKSVQDKSQSLYEFSKSETIWYEDYNGIAFMTEEKDFYCITDSYKDGMYNYINYKSNTKDVKIVIDSFDINCTTIGYSIDEDKFYWTKEFENFLETGQLTVTNIRTPSHTTLRILKKAEDLNAKLDTFELKVLQFALSEDTNLGYYKVRFQERYLEMYIKYIDKLSEFFYLSKDLQAIHYVKQTHNKDVNLWRLHSLNKRVFNDTNLNSVRSNNYLFYVRNIYKNKYLATIWKNLHYFYDNANYVDKEVSEEDILLLSRFVTAAPKAISNLKGLKLSEQIKLVKRLLNAYKEDPIIAISVLEFNKLDKDIVLDEQMKLLLELSVRKEIINDTKNKVERVFNTEKDDEPFEDLYTTFTI